MVAPDGDTFIFIHRCRCNCERYDRLMYYNFIKGDLKCLLTGKMQSHFCWIDNNTVFGYGQQGNDTAFYEIEVNTGSCQKCAAITDAHPKDGHPTVHGDWIIIDSYPDFSRMQNLTAYNRKTDTIILLGEFHHDMKHAVYTRCDLHPRFNTNGDKLYFDTLYSKKGDYVR